MDKLHGLPIPSMDWTAGNLPETFRKFRRNHETVFAGPLIDQDEEVKINKRVRSSSGQSQNCVRLGTSRDKKRLFQVASSKFFDDRRVLRKKIAGTRIFT